jgi:2-desacetyl-2-hydroxyethyl bacteriochlorophyllide A dehydrogenase
MNMKSMMKAAILVRPGEMKVEEVPVPDPAPGWLRLKVKACGICGSDMHYYKGNYPELESEEVMEKKALGKIYGHEASGVVDKLGEGVTGLKAGERVAIIPPVACMKCTYCRVGLYEHCKGLEIIGYEYPGAFAEYTAVPASNVFQIPDAVSFEEAATLDVLAVGVHAVHKGKVSISDRVVVLGAGAIGLALAAVAKKAGAREIFMTAKYPRQKEIAERMGIKNILDASDPDIVEKIFQKTENRGVDCVLESVGVSGKVIEQGIAMLAKGGRLVFTGLFEERVNLSFWDVLIKEATITASGAYGMWCLVPEFALAVEMLSKGEFPAKDIITHRFAIERINEAFQQKLEPEERKNTIKVGIVF